MTKTVSEREDERKRDKDGKKKLNKNIINSGMMRDSNTSQNESFNPNRLDTLTALSYLEHAMKKFDNFLLLPFCRVFNQ